jgi:periplasmic protein TonB
VVLLRVAVRPDGGATEVKVLSDPGYGFGQAARSCAIKTRFQPAQDAAGKPMFAWSGPIRVRFIR